LKCVKELYESKSDLSDYTDEQLYEMLDERRKNTKAKEIKELCAKTGITPKDFAVEYADWIAKPDDDDFNPTFSFYIKHKGINYDIYSGFKKSLKWWPTVRDEYEGAINVAHEFIPGGFDEVTESAYQFNGNIEEAIECLKKHGFTDITDVQHKTR